MNTNNIVVNEESLINLINTSVVVKFKRGRAISGILVKNSEGYSIKLGVQYIPVDLPDVAKVTPLN